MGCICWLFSFQLTLDSRLFQRAADGISGIEEPTKPKKPKHRKIAPGKEDPRINAGNDTVLGVMMTTLKNCRQRGGEEERRTMYLRACRK